MVVQNISANGKETDLTFTIKSDDLIKTKKIILQNKKINFRDLMFDKNVSKVSIIGVGMVTTPGVTYRMFQSLANQNINILVISTSEIKISVLINKKNVKKAISLAQNEKELLTIRRKLFENVLETPLFDCKKFCDSFFSSLEKIYN